MLKSLRLFLPNAVCILILLTAPVGAQSTKKIQIPADKLDCFLEHQQKYLDVPRAVVSFTPAYCPALTRAEVIAAARAAQNSASDLSNTTLKRNLLNKARLRCMFQQIAAYRAENPVPESDASDETTDTSAEGAGTGEVLEFTLDCS